jgi:hypothetical protein
MSMAALEPSDAAPPRRVERGGYSEVDVRKALLYLLAHVEQGIAPPTPWFVAHKKLGVPAMYELVRACVLSFRVRTCGGDAHPGAALRHPCRGARARFSCVWARPNPCAEALVALGHACAQLKNAWAAIEKMSADARRAAIAAYELPRKGGAKSSIKTGMCCSSCTKSRRTHRCRRVVTSAKSPPGTRATTTANGTLQQGG